MRENQLEIEKFFDKETHKFKEDIRFALQVDAKMGYQIHYYAPCTGGDECVVPKGTKFIVTESMRDDAFYLHRVGERVYDELNLMLVEKARESTKEILFRRLGGFSFFITEEQIKTLPLEFQSGSRDILLAVISFMKSRWELELQKMGRV